MRKIVLFALSIVAMASCSKNEMSEINYNSPNIINFATYINANTKADIVTTDNIDEIGVYATSSKGNLTSQYIPNERVYKDGTTWSSNTSYYWPSDITKTLYFYGYSPFYGNDSEQNSDFTASSPVIKDYPQIEKLAVNQKDIVVAQASRAIVDAKSDNKDVLLNFEHILSLIKVKINLNCDENTLKDDYVYGSDAPNETDKYDDENDDRITLYYNLASIGFVNIKGNHNGLNLVDKSLVVDQTNSSCEYSYSSVSKLGACQVNSSKSKSESTFDGGFKLLPQELIASNTQNSNVTLGAALKIDFALEQFGHFIVGSYKGAREYNNTKVSEDDAYYSNNDINLVTAYFPIHKEAYKAWEQGKVYTYVLDVNFDNTSIYVGYDKDGELILDEDDKLSLSVTTDKWPTTIKEVLND